MQNGYRQRRRRPGERLATFWEQYGTLSTVNWCEPNYIWVTFVAEWWNTLTSLPMGIAGLLGWICCLRSAEKIPPRFHLAFLGLSAIGFGSVAFHGTLLRTSQALDELPMIGLSLVFMYGLAVRNDHTLPPRRALIKQRLWAIGSTVYGVAFTLAYFLAESYFIVFLVSYGSMVAFVIGRSWWVTFKKPRLALLERVGWLAFGTFAFGFFGLWIPERVMECYHPLQALHLHSGWHITSTIGGYGWCLWALIDRKRLLGEPVQLVWTGFGPFVR